MKEVFYYNLKESFVKIKLLFSANVLDTNKVDAVVGDLKFSRKQIEKHSKRREKRLLLCCIDTLLRFIEEDKKEKICDFASVICDIPDIFLGKRNYYSFREDINAFNEKYGEHTFKDMNKIHPYFSKKAPENAFEFFSPESDESFKAQHPIGYWVLVAFGIIAFVLPLIIYTIYISKFDENQSIGGWFLPAIVGCLVMGVGLFNIVAAFIHQYLGHKLTWACLLGGGAVVGLSMFMTENPQLYDADVSTFYFVSLFMMLLPAIFYARFRQSVEYWLNRSKKISRSRFKKLTKGKKNYWWYETLHKEVNLGAIYFLNKSFTILFVTLFLLTLFTGYIKEMSLILCPMNVILYVLTAFMVLFSRIQDNLDFHRKPFVLLAKSSNGGIDSVIRDIFMVLFVLAMAYANMMFAGDIWGISLPHL